MLWFGFRAHAKEISVVDGDSIHWRRGGWGDDGKQTDGARKFRLAGYDAPELGERAKSAREADWAHAAKLFLEGKIKQADKLRLKTSGRTPRGEEVAILYINGVDAKDVMVGARMGAIPQWRDGHMIRPKWDEMDR